MPIYNVAYKLSGEQQREMIIVAGDPAHAEESFKQTFAVADLEKMSDVVVSEKVD